jgi:monoamine oxidase
MDEKNVSALTFFTLADADKSDDVLARDVAQQMEKVWSYLGEKEAAQKVHSFTEHHVKRWPQEPYISEDPRPQRIHPHPQVEPDLSTPEWDGLLQFSGSETDRLSPGVMEGAIGAAQRCLQTLQTIWKQEAIDTKACNSADIAGR